MRPVPVVMPDILAEYDAEMTFTSDQHPVSALAANSAHPALSDRIGAAPAAAW
jgi:hypothetical protein